MNFLIQKATELGINEINIFKSERSSFKVDKDQLNKKKVHWNKVAIAACEQSGRTRIPKIETFQSLESLISGPSASEPTEAKLILCPKGSKTIEIITRPPERVVIAVGPEGGFTNQEVASAISCGFSDIRLGPRTLRTETAGISLIAGIQTLWGDF
jgi:16S rRNA (uracil1498-N3)-methyltransferase